MSLSKRSATSTSPRFHHAPAKSLLGLAVAALLASCGGSSGNPIGNPETVTNPTILTGQHLAFAYFQKCVNPIFLAQLQIDLNGATSTNTCAGAGCHATATGT